MIDRELLNFRKGKLAVIRLALEATAKTLPIKAREELRKAFYAINKAERMLEEEPPAAPPADGERKGGGRG